MIRCKKESSIERTFCKKLRDRDCLTPKISDNPGWPDRLIIFPEGRHCFIEFKRPGGALSKIQETVITGIASRGHKVFVVSGDKNEDVDNLMDHMRA